MNNRRHATIVSFYTLSAHSTNQYDFVCCLTSTKFTSRVSNFSTILYDRLATKEVVLEQVQRRSGKWISVELSSHRSVELGSSNCALNPTYRCASRRERQHRHPSTRLSRFSKMDTVHRNRRESRNAYATAEFYRAFTWKPSSSLSEEVPELTPFEVVFHSKYRPSKPDRYHLPRRSLARWIHCRKNRDCRCNAIIPRFCSKATRFQPLALATDYGS